MRSLFLVSIIMCAAISPVSGKTLSEGWRGLRSSWMSSEMRFTCGASVFKLGKFLHGQVKLDWLNAKGNWVEMKILETADEAIVFVGLGEIGGVVALNFSEMQKSKHIQKVLEAIEKPGRNMAIVDDQIYDFADSFNESSRESIIREIINPKSSIVTLVPKDYSTPDVAMISKVRAEASKDYLWVFEPVDLQQFIPLRYMINFSTADFSGQLLDPIRLNVSFEGEPRSILPKSFLPMGREVSSVGCGYSE